MSICSEYKDDENKLIWNWELMITYRVSVYSTECWDLEWDEMRQYLRSNKYNNNSGWLIISSNLQAHKVYSEYKNDKEINKILLGENDQI